MSTPQLTSECGRQTEHDIRRQSELHLLSVFIPKPAWDREDAEVSRHGKGWWGASRGNGVELLCTRVVLSIRPPRIMHWHERLGSDLNLFL
jgi:hypothetical protein